MELSICQKLEDLNKSNLSPLSQFKIASYFYLSVKYFSNYSNLEPGHIFGTPCIFLDTISYDFASLKLSLLSYAIMKT